MSIPMIAGLYPYTRAGISSASCLMHLPTPIPVHARGYHSSTEGDTAGNPG